MIVIALISFILPTASVMTHLSDLLMFYLLHLSPKQFVPNTNVFYDGRMKELGHIWDYVDLIGKSSSNSSEMSEKESRNQEYRERCNRHR